MSIKLICLLYFAGGVILGVGGVLFIMGASINENEQEIYQRGIKEGIRRTWVLIRKFKGIVEVRNCQNDKTS